MHSAPCLHALAQLAPPLMHCFGCRWWWPRIFSGTSSPTCPGRLPARSDSTPPRTSTRSAPTPPSSSRSAPSLSLDSPCAVLRLACSLHFTGARLGPGHHREGHCQPCRRDPLCSQCVPIICCVLCPHTACPAAASIALLSQRKCSAALAVMLDWLKLPEPAAELRAAVTKTLATSRTPDAGGSLTTKEFTAKVIESLRL